jgi:hypothetical protein
MLLRTCSIFVVLLSACATTETSLKSQAPGNLRLANLQRAAALPWTDDGRCVVREAANEWAVLAERCFHALDHKRVRFNDVTKRCAVAQVGAAALGGVGLCILAGPAIAQAVVVIGAVVVAAAIAAELAAYARREWPAPEAAREAVKPAPQPQPTREPVANQRPKPEGSPLGPDWFPPGPFERDDRPECKPIPVPHRGGDDLHNKCADTFPPNRYPGMDVLVGGIYYDALQVGVPVLWEIKTDQFDTYSPFLQKEVVKKESPKLREERKVAVECGYDFVVGVSSAAHKAALEREARELKIVVTGCPR